MRVLVTGDRNWDDQAHDNLISSLLDGLYTEHEVGYLTTHVQPFTVIEGKCPYGGADAVAEWWALHSPLHAYPGDEDNYCAVHHEPYPADWDQFGKAAGAIRNQRMLDEGKPTIVLAFKDAFDWTFKHGGTEDMVKRSKHAQVPTYVISRADEPTLL